MLYYKMVLTEERHNKSAAHLRLIHEGGQSVLADILSSFDYMSPDEVLFVTFVVTEIFKALNPHVDETRDYLVDYVSQYSTDYYQNNYEVRLHSALNLLMTSIDLVIDKLSTPSRMTYVSDTPSPVLAPAEATTTATTTTTTTTTTADTTALTPSSSPTEGSISAPPPIPAPVPTFPHEFNEANRHYYPSLYRINRRIRRYIRSRAGYTTVVEAIRASFNVDDVITHLNSRGHRLC
jgi:hypothetical protein